MVKKTPILVVIPVQESRIKNIHYEPNTINIINYIKQKIYLKLCFTNIGGTYIGHCMLLGTLLRFV